MNIDKVNYEIELMINEQLYELGLITYEIYIKVRDKLDILINIE